MKVVLYILLIGFILLVFEGISFLTHDPNHPTLNEEAIEPDLMLKNARTYVNENSYDRGLYHLRKAIEGIKKIEMDVDLTTEQVVDVAVSHLEAIEEKILSDTLEPEELENAFAEALNALTLAELRISETYAETNKLDKAKVALKYALLHMKNVIQFSNGSLQEEELKVYYEIDSLLNDHSINPIDMMLKLDGMIKKMDSLVHKTSLLN